MAGRRSIEYLLIMMMVLTFSFQIQDSFNQGQCIRIRMNILTFYLYKQSVQLFFVFELIDKIQIDVLFFRKEQIQIRKITLRLQFVYSLQLMLSQQVQKNPIQIIYKTQGLSERMKKQVSGLVSALDDPMIQIKTLRAYLGEGIPDEVSVVRQYTWKVILGYLPRVRSRWSDQIQKQQKTYNDFINIYLPQSKFQDYPLLMNKNHPLWKEYEYDYYMWEQIEKDTCRTQSDLSFFSEEVQAIQIPFATSARKERYKMINGDGPQVIKTWLSNKEQQRKTYRYDYMSRILFIYAKLNPKAAYVQGMNQVLAPIFYLVNNRKKEMIDEAACFFMFNNVMTDLIELNIQAFDKRQNGIHGRIQEINKILLAVEPKIWQRLQELKIDSFFYCFRWLTLLFAQQFQLFETLRVWESIFSFEDRATFVNFFAVTLISMSKDTIMKEEYARVLGHLKHIREHINLSNALFRASEMYHQLKGVDIIGLAQRNYDKLNKKQTKLLTKTKSLINIFKKFI